MRLFLSTIIFFAASSACTSVAQEGADWLSDGKPPAEGVVSNENSMLGSENSAFHLATQAERALKSGHLDRAYDLIKKSIELDNEDTDAHVIYATVLEKKLERQSKEDPFLFNACVKEWLAILRNSYGDEKGDHFHGIGLPGLAGKFNEDTERQVPARQHLIKLTGVSPRPWETNAKFLQKVLRSGETTVKGQMLGENSAVNTGAEGKSSAIPASKTR